MHTITHMKKKWKKMDSNAFMLQHYSILQSIIMVTALVIGTVQNISLLKKIQRLKMEVGFCTPSDTPICCKNDCSVNSSIWTKFQLRIYECHLSQHTSLQICYLSTLTYLLTPWTRVLLEKLTGFASNQETPRILWNPQVHYRTHKRPPSVPVLSQFHPVPTTPSHLLKIHLNIILPSTSWSPQWSLSLRFTHQNPVHTSPLLHMCHMPCPSHSRFYHPHNIGWGVQIIKLLIM